MLALVIYLILWIYSILFIITASLNCRKQRTNHSALCARRVWVRFKAQKKTKERFCCLFYSKVPQVCRFALSDLAPVCLVLWWCRVKKEKKVVDSYETNIVFDSSRRGPSPFAWPPFNSGCTYCTRDVTGNHSRVLPQCHVWGVLHILPTEFPHRGLTLLNHARFWVRLDQSQDLNLFEYSFHFIIISALRCRRVCRADPDVLPFSNRPFCVAPERNREFPLKRGFLSPCSTDSTGSRCCWEGEWGCELIT